MQTVLAHTALSQSQVSLTVEHTIMTIHQCVSYRYIPDREELNYSFLLLDNMRRMFLFFTTFTAEHWQEYSPVISGILAVMLLQYRVFVTNKEKKNLTILPLTFST